MRTSCNGDNRKKAIEGQIPKTYTRLLENADAILFAFHSDRLREGDDGCDGRGPAKAVSN